MELTVDVQGKLIPNIVTLIVQLCSTGVIIWFAAKYLWKPARKYLEDKAALTQKPLDDALEKQKEAEIANAQAKDNLEKAAKKAEELIKNGEVQGKKLKDELVSEAQKQASQMLSNANKEIEAQKIKMRNDVQSEIVSVALAATEKIIKDNANAQKNKEAIEDFIKDVNNG